MKNISKVINILNIYFLWINLFSKINYFILTLFIEIINSEGEPNPHLKQVIGNCENAPETDSEMEMMIRLPQ